MVTTSTLRREYPDLIVSYSGPRCNYSSTVPVVFLAGGSAYPSGRVVLRVHPLARQAFRAQAAVMLAHGYAFRETAGGTLACRYIGGTTSTSLHAHGIAKDDNPSKNRYRVQTGPVQLGRQTDMPSAMIRDLEALRTVSGHRLLQWGGRWTNIKDPMHWELDCYRSQLKTGVNLATLPAGAWSRYLAFENGQQQTGEEMLYGLDIGSAGEPSLPDAPAHRVLQAFLVRQGQDLGAWGPHGDGVDGKPGDDTRAGLHRWKLAVGITAETSAGDGKVGDYEMAAIYAAGGAAGASTDQVARDMAASADKKASAARTVANRAEAGANRANATLDKVRSE
jgi:hypothetical protein